MTDKSRAEDAALRPLPRISIVVPLYNESENVEKLLKELDEVLGRQPINQGHEVICVDDGSTDDTLPRLRDLIQRCPYLRVIGLSRNFGHQAAVTAGLDHVRGDVALVMDGDLQDDPHILPKFVDEYRRGADVVYAQRVMRKESLWLRVAYAAHYRLLAMLSNVAVPVDAGDFALMSKQVVEVLQSMPERQRYVRGLRAWAGFKQVGVPVQRNARTAGESKYNLRRLARLASDGILAFSIVPLRISTILGALGLLAGFIYALYAVITRLATGSVPRGFTTLALLEIAFGGAVLLMLGVVGEYVGRIYEEVKARPLYVVAARYGADDG